MRYLYKIADVAIAPRIITGNGNFAITAMIATVSPAKR